METVSITRHDHGAYGEYRAHVEGHREIGRLTWVHKDGVRAAEHTLVPPEIGGRGIAGRLVEDMVADAREAGFKVHPVCSYVVKAFEKHPDWADIAA
ncbi:MAG TPA: GNAT family N-acetyltransferase [Novosphingobium sp.]|nr:GNAT family N-acetyltransferase [Novosphingobium sp.]